MSDKNTVWFIAWDDIGLEYMLDMTQYMDDNNLLTTIAAAGDPNARPKTSRDPLFYMQMRARFNSHRNYELWLLPADPSITRKMLEDSFENSPDMIKDMIREKGTKVNI
jgi:hypothetical protein